jgi:hypothetical protein
MSATSEKKHRQQSSQLVSPMRPSVHDRVRYLTGFDQMRCNDNASKFILIVNYYTIQMTAAGSAGGEPGEIPQLNKKSPVSHEQHLLRDKDKLRR